MEKVDLSKLAAIPYLDLSDLQGRTFSSLCFHDGDWKMWISAGDQLMQIHAWPAESCFFARAPECQSDLCLQTLNFIAQRASFPELMKAFVGFQDDVFNVSASLAKIGLLHAHRDTIKHGIGRMAVTEVEYILSVCRSMFDLLQEMVSHLWERIQLVDSAIRKRSLKQSFTDMILQTGKPASATQIIERFGLPPALAEVYVKHSQFFLSLRRIRDNVVHRGSQMQTIFDGDRGFLVAAHLRPFSDWNIWREDEREPNNLVPLLPALGLIVHHTLNACEEFFHALEGVIRFPAPLVPGMAFFMRGYFNDEFVAVLRDAAQREAASQSVR
jgi:hypothetical protein